MISSNFLFNCNNLQTIIYIQLIILILLYGFK